MGMLRAMTAVLAGLLLAGIGWAQEKKIKRSELPPAVERTVVEISKGATVEGFSEETEKGKRTYEVEMVVNGHTKDVELDPNGTVLEVEEEAVMDSLPANVKVGLTAKADGGKTLKVESITKNGKLVAYEARVETTGKKSEIHVAPDGKPLDRNE